MWAAPALDVFMGFISFHMARTTTPVPPPPLLLGLSDDIGNLLDARVVFVRLHHQLSHFPPTMPYRGCVYCDWIAPVES